jgi:hypothetical protein
MNTADAATTYRVGLDIGPRITSWAVVGYLGTERVEVAGGTEDSVVAVDDTGRLVAGSAATTAPPGRLSHVTGHFVEALGRAEPVIVGSTPYGAEALVARVVGAVLARVRAVRGAPPTAVAVAHADDFDLYRQSLLVESLRQADVPLDDIVIVAHTDARRALSHARVATTSELELATGAALAEVVGEDRTGLAAAGLVGGASALAGGAVLGRTVLSNAASAGLAGPAGTPLTAPAGPMGSPLQPPTGPAGAPLAPPAGPTGTPLQPPPAGPAGTPIGAGGRGIRPLRVWLVVGAAVAVIAAGVGIAVASHGSGHAKSSPRTTSAPVTTSPSTTATPASTAATVTPTTAALTVPPTVADTIVSPACVTGNWTVEGEPLANIITAHLDNGGIAQATVSGTVTMTITTDGTVTITFNSWTISGTNPVLPGKVSLTRNGVDTGTGSFTSDGSMSFTDKDNQVKISTKVDIPGGFPATGSASASSLINGSGTYTCSSTQLVLNVSGSPGPLILDRTA